MAISQFQIADRSVGGNEPCFIVGEVAQAHDGSLGTAHAFIEAIAKAGADAVKFQTHIAQAESSSQEPFRIKFSQQDATRFDYWKRMEFSRGQWAELAAHARECGLIFLSSPFSEEAVELLEQIGMPAWKIASGEVNNPLLLERIFQTRKPILLSTGMSHQTEIDRIVNMVKAQEIPLAVFQCTSRYPSQPTDIGLNMLKVFQDRYEVPVGFSDHSGRIFPGLAAVTLGVSILEVHVTLSRDMFGPDVPASLLPIELKQLVEGTRFIEKALDSPINKDTIADELSEMRTVFGKSLVVRTDGKAGQILERKILTGRKPGTGIPVGQLENVVGKVLTRDVKAGEFLLWTDVADD